MATATSKEISLSDGLDDSLVPPATSADDLAARGSVLAMQIVVGALLLLGVVALGFNAGLAP